MNKVVSYEVVRHRDMVISGDADTGTLAHRKERDPKTDSFGTTQKCRFVMKDLEFNKELQDRHPCLRR